MIENPDIQTNIVNILSGLSGVVILPIYYFYYLKMTEEKREIRRKLFLKYFVWTVFILLLMISTTILRIINNFI